MNHLKLAALSGVSGFLAAAVVHAQALPAPAQDVSAKSPAAATEPSPNTAQGNRESSSQANTAPQANTTPQASPLSASVAGSATPSVQQPVTSAGAPAFAPLTTGDSSRLVLNPPPPLPVDPTKPAAPPPPVPATSKWNLSLYGMVEFNIMRDSTQSLPDSGIGATPVARPGTYASEHARWHFTTRNSRFGMKVTAPDYEGVKTTAVLEMDFFGYTQGASEGGYMSNGTVRMRLANIKMETKYIDILVGQTYHMFAWMPFFYPCTSSFFPMPNMPFGRQPQVRLSKTIKTDAINIDLAGAAVRPPQRDSQMPDFQGGIKFGFNGWKGIHSLGAGSALLDPFSIGVSGVVRRFEVTEFGAASTRENRATGRAMSVGAFIPVIPASSVEDRGNALSLTGTFITGTGIGDLGGFVTAPAYPPTPAAANGTPGPAYTPNLDNGLVTYDASGQLHTLNWKGFNTGFQYYFPPSGKVWFAANYNQGESNNVTRYMSSATVASYSKNVVKKSQYADATLFIDIMPALRTGLLYGFYRQTYGDGVVAKNHRAEIAMYCYF